jgi:nucleotide-binding universal stress UspA family protein
MDNILCPTDLSATSMTGVRYAELLAARLQCSISLLHVVDKREQKEDGGNAAREKMGLQQTAIAGAPVKAEVREGEFMHEIAEESRSGHALMVCATHGIRGLRQSLFGPDILKLVRKVSTPTLVVQERSPLDNGFGTIVMPVAAHPGIDHLLDAVILLAKPFGSNVHIYQLIRPGEQASADLERNKKHMMERLAAEGIDHRMVEEPSHGFSVGFAAPTIAYAEKVKAGCIAIMSVASEEYRYIADAEKERMLTNEPAIPVLCAR